MGEFKKLLFLIWNRFRNFPISRLVIGGAVDREQFILLSECFPGSFTIDCLRQLNATANIEQLSPTCPCFVASIIIHFRLFVQHQSDSASLLQFSALRGHSLSVRPVPQRDLNATFLIIGYPSRNERLHQQPSLRYCVIFGYHHRDYTPAQLLLQPAVTPLLR